MLEYMWHSGVVWRVCLETNREDIVLVLTGHMKVVGASFIMLEVQCCQLELGDMLQAHEGEAMELLSWLGVQSQFSNGFANRTFGGAPEHLGQLLRC